MIAQSLWKRDFLILLDLSNAYFHAPVARDHLRSLQFKFKGLIFQLRAMHFGLSSAPYLFTKITHPVALFCRWLDIQITFCLDDSLIMARSCTEAIAHGDFVVSLLRHLGFLISLHISDLSPTQQLTFLGLCWDLRRVDWSHGQESDQTIVPIFQHVSTVWRCFVNDLLCRNILEFQFVEIIWA